MYVLLKRIFASITREELADILRHQADAARKEHMEQHKENRESFDEIFRRVGDVERTLARLDGRLGPRPRTP